MEVINTNIFITISFLLSLIVSVALMPIVNKIGLKYKVLDIPDQRKQHKGEIVRIGGIAIFLGFIIGLIGIIIISSFYLNISINLTNYLKVIFSAFLFFLLGISDDIFNMKPLTRLLIQIIFGSLMYFMNIKFDALDINWMSQENNIFLLNDFFSYIFTILWVVGITNALNWLDGLDGLAGGLSIISQLGLITIFLFLSKWELVFLCSALLGSSVGFLRYNFFPAKILMGDGGSYLLGSMLGTLSIIGLGYEQQINGQQYQIFPITIAIFLIFIPIFDMVFVMLERSFKGYSVFYPDRRHLHYKLLRKGLHPRSVVIIYYGIAQAFCCLAVTLVSDYFNTFLICLSFILFIFSLLYCLNFKNNL